MLFANSERSASTSPPVSTESPNLRILSLIREHASTGNTQSELNKKVVRVTASAIYAAFSQIDDLVEWSKSAESLLPTSPERLTDAIGENQTSDAANETPSRTSSFVPVCPIAESCEMCDSEILMTSDLTSARCKSGHVFVRCSISFLAIQEPGFSKHCSRCSKQFLDLAKLEPPSAPSLVQALFEEFDVCPFCPGKFRG